MLKALKNEIFVIASQTSDKLMYPYRDGTFCWGELLLQYILEVGQGTK